MERGESFMRNRQTIPAVTPWVESICYSRAVRSGNFVAVSQTSAANSQGVIAGGADPFEQAVHALRNVESALRAAGAEFGDVVRSRIYIARFEDLPQVAKAHANVFRDIRPAVSIVTCTMISPEILVEFEVDAIVESAL
jgi:enamine deaminase RidA (YjgF/YER057c/UK114 family)